MNIVEIVVPIAVGSLIGYCTNYIAIKMLFLPRKEWHIGKWKVPFTPGVIPKNQGRIATAVSNAVNEKLLTEKDIVDNLKSDGIKGKIVDNLMIHLMSETTTLQHLMQSTCETSDTQQVIKQITGVLSNKIIDGIKSLDMNVVIHDIMQSSFSNLLSNPMIAMFLGGNFMDSICDKVAVAIGEYIDTNGQQLIAPMVQQEIDAVMADSVKNNLSQFGMAEDSVRKLLDGIIENFIDNNAAALIGRLKIKSIVEEKINKMDVRELEDLVMSIMKNELQTVINLGAIIGAVIGVINIFI